MYSLHVDLQTEISMAILPLVLQLDTADINNQTLSYSPQNLPSEANTVEQMVRPEIQNPKRTMLICTQKHIKVYY